MAAGTHKPLPLPARPMFRPPAAPIHLLPPLDVVRALAAEVAQANARAKPGFMEEIAAKDAAEKAAEAQANADLIAQALAERLKPLFDAARTDTADDLYNLAILQNPGTFAVMQGRVSGGSIAASTTGMVKVVRNDFLVPAVVIGRVDNSPANDVVGVYLSDTQAPVADAPALTTGSTFIAVLRSNQTLWIGALASTFPATISYTIVPLRGRAAVFGG